MTAFSYDLKNVAQAVIAALKEVAAGIAAAQRGMFGFFECHEGFYGQMALSITVTSMSGSSLQALKTQPRKPACSKTRTQPPETAAGCSPSASPTGFIRLTDIMHSCFINKSALEACHGVWSLYPSLRFDL